MISQFEHYLTFENLYIFANLGVLPFWIMLIFIPNSKFTQILINSVILPLILALTYIYIIYQTLLLEESFVNIFKIYLSIDNLYTLFSSESFLLLFWIHFLTISLFLGLWISRDSIRYNMPRGLVGVHLILIYFTGPVGLVLYWCTRIFYSKKLGFYD